MDETRIHLWLTHGHLVAVKLQASPQDLRVDIGLPKTIVLGDYTTPQNTSAQVAKSAQAGKLLGSRGAGTHSKSLNLLWSPKLRYRHSKFGDSWMGCCQILLFLLLHKLKLIRFKLWARGQYFYYQLVGQGRTTSCSIAQLIKCIENYK